MLLLMVIVVGVFLTRLLKLLVITGPRSKYATYDLPYDFLGGADLGQFKPTEPRGRPDSLTNDDIAWAREIGAETDEEIIDYVRKHKEEVGN